MSEYPIRLRIQRALVAALEEITVANGYQHDLTDSVFRGRATYGDSAPLPMVSILEPIDEDEQTPTPQAGPVNKGQWTLLIQGFVQDDFDNPTDPAHNLLADVKKRLIMERIRDQQYDILGLGDYVMDIEIGPGVVRPPDEVSAKAYFWLRLRLSVVENLENPFA